MVIVKTPIKRLNIDIIIDKDYCKGCGYCTQNCERGVYEMEIINAQERKGKVRKGKHVNCVGCGYCELGCPNQAIWVKNGWHDKHIIIPQEE